MTVVELRFPAPSTPPSINAVTGKHWAVRRRMLEPWRTAAGWAWNALPREVRAEVAGRRCSVHLTIPFAARRARDPHNYVGTVCKAVVDQLVEQGAWPDDTPAWVTVPEPTLVHGHEVTVALEVLQHPDEDEDDDDHEDGE